MSEHVREVSDSSFEKDVLTAAKPVLVDFWAEWCAPCRMLAPTVAAVAEHYGDNASVVKLNVDDNPSTAQRYGIKGIPTLILFRDGKEVETPAHGLNIGAVHQGVSDAVGREEQRFTWLVGEVLVRVGQRRVGGAGEEDAVGHRRSRACR